MITQPYHFLWSGRNAAGGCLINRHSSFDGIWVFTAPFGEAADGLHKLIECGFPGVEIVHTGIKTIRRKRNKISKNID